MGPARIYPWRRMHRSRAPSIAPGTFFVAQSWAGCIINMPGFNLRQAGVARASVRLEAHYGLKSDIAQSPKSADCVAKVFLQHGAQILRAVGAAIEQSCGGPHQLTMNS